ncbi:MAG: DUF1203 domain-containing protein [Actinomycetia bacterium]|nr:DUF1203 domain-containing protein [Actinomycetes bacterium]
MNNQIVFNGIDSDELTSVLARGIDHGGNRIAPFVDDEGGWPLRCCLQDSKSGDEIAIIAWSPFEWDGPYRETGPIVVHTGDCARSATFNDLPENLNRHPMTLRPYGREHTILYGLVEHLPEGDDLTKRTRALFTNDDVVEVYAKNATGGCFAFVARRNPPT